MIVNNVKQKIFENTWKVLSNIYLFIESTIPKMTTLSSIKIYI